MHCTIVCSVIVLSVLSPWDAVKLTLEIFFICPSVVIDPADKGATTVVAPGRTLDNFLPIPDAESLHLYHMVLKLACVVAHLPLLDNVIVADHNKPFETQYLLIHILFLGVVLNLLKSLLLQDGY